MNRRAKLFPFLAAPLAALISSQAFGTPTFVSGLSAALEASSVARGTAIFTVVAIDNTATTGTTIPDERSAP